MPTDRRIYASQSVFVGPTPATGNHRTSGASGESLLTELHRVQSVNYNFAITRQDVNQFGRLAALSREIIEQPTVSLDLEFLDYNGHNEDALGFSVGGDVSCISGIINSTSDEKNYFVVVAPNDEDWVGQVSNNNEFAVIGIGNGFINNYTSRGAVGGLPSVTIGVEALNFKVDLNRTGQTIPAVNPVDGSGITTVTYDVPDGVTGLGPAALRPGDIELEISTVGQNGVGVSVADMKAQSYEFTVPLARTNLNKLGSRFAFAKKMTFPITVTASVTADIGDYQTGSLANLLCEDNSYDITVTLREPACLGSGPVAKKYTLKNAKLTSQNFTSSIGPNNSVVFNWEGQIGGAEDVNNGVFISGSLS